MNDNKDNGPGMLVTEGHEWTITFDLHDYDERINNLNPGNKEILLCLLEQKWYPRLYETISIHAVDYGDSVKVQVDGFTKKWENIPTGFKMEKEISEFVEKALEILELEIRFEKVEI